MHNCSKEIRWKSLYWRLLHFNSHHFPNSSSKKTWVVLSKVRKPTTWYTRIKTQVVIYGFPWRPVCSRQVQALFLSLFKSISEKLDYFCGMPGKSNRKQIRIDSVGPNRKATKCHDGWTKLWTTDWLNVIIKQGDRDQVELIEQLSFLARPRRRTAGTHMLTEVSRQICEDLYFSVWILLGWILLSFSASSAIPYYLINNFQVGIDEQFDDLISDLCSRSAHA